MGKEGALWGNGPVAGKPVTLVYKSMNYPWRVPKQQVQANGASKSDPRDSSNLPLRSRPSTRRGALAGLATGRPSLGAAPEGGHLAHHFPAQGDTTQCAKQRLALGASGGSDIMAALLAGGALQLDEADTTHPKIVPGVRGGFSHRRNTPKLLEHDCPWASHGPFAHVR